MQATIKYVLQRLSEPSTWMSLAVLLSVVGVEFAPETQDKTVEFFKNIGQGSGLIVSGIGIFWKRDSQSEKPPIVHPELPK